MSVDGPIKVVRTGVLTNAKIELIADTKALN